MIPIIETVSKAISSVSEGIVEIIKEFHLEPEKAIILQNTMREKLMQFELAMYQLIVNDKANARDREIKLQDPTTRRLAYATLGLFSAVLVMQFTFAWFNHQISTPIQRTLDISTGVLFAMVLAVKDYYFGTSHGSAKKDETLDRVVNHRD